MTSAQPDTNNLLERFRIFNTLTRLGSPWIFPTSECPSHTIHSNVKDSNDKNSNDEVCQSQPITTNCVHDKNGITEVVLEIETLNGIPVDSMITLIKFETMIASLYASVRVHHRNSSMYGSLPIETIFRPVVLGCMCKGICHAVDIHGCLRILSNCLSRALFVHHNCIPFIYIQLLKCFSNCSPGYVDDTINESCRITAIKRVERFLRLLNDEMYNWRGFVIKPMPKRAPYSMYDTDIDDDAHFQHKNEQDGISKNILEQNHICNIFTNAFCFSKLNKKSHQSVAKEQNNTLIF
jgi:hypothetical protein